MKKILIFLFLFAILTACNLFHIGTHRNTTVEFIFVDVNGKDIFADSLSVDDFQIESIEGYAAFNFSDTVNDKNYFRISFGEGSNGDKKSVTLFHLKNDVDTVEVTFKNDNYKIRDLNYNGEIIKFESDVDSYCTIVK